MKMQKILLFQPPSPPGMKVSRDYAGGMGTARATMREDYGHDSWEVIPYLSLLYLTGIVDKKKWDIFFIDAQLEKMTRKDVLKGVSNISPDVIIAVLNLPSLEGDLSLLSDIKSQCPETLIVGIGTVCKVLWDYIMGNGILDILIRENPEIVLTNLLDALEKKKDLDVVPSIVFRRDGKFVSSSNTIEGFDLNKIPAPDYHLIPVNRYRFYEYGPDVPTFYILSSKGCPYGCAYYCPYPLGFGKKVTFRDPEKVVDEIQLLVEKYKIQGILFRDQVFTINKNHTRRICEELLKRRVKIRWTCETRFDTVDKDLLKLMKKAGCDRIHYGLESGDPEIFKKYGKPGKDIEGFGEIIELTRKADIIPHTHLIIGLPGESWKTIENTVRFLKKWKVPSIHVSLITPYPGTPLYKEAEGKKFILTKDYSLYTINHPLIRTEYLTGEELLRAKEYINRIFYRINTPYIQRVLNKIKTVMGYKIK